MKNQIEWPYHLFEAFTKVPHLGGLQEEILDLTKESFEGLKYGLNRSSVIVAGEALQRLNCALLTSHIIVMTDIGQKVAHKKIDKLHLENLGDFDIAQKLRGRISLDDSILILRDFELIDTELSENMEILRYLRNETTHARPPGIHSYDLPLDSLGLNIEDVLNIPTGLEPLSWQRYRFVINTATEDKVFIINPEKLMIDLRDLEFNKIAPTISLGILFMSIKNMVEKVKWLFSLLKQDK
jgi:hypothetical protein